MSIPGADRLADIWSALRVAYDARERNRLVDSAVTAVAWHQQAVHEARHAAVKLLIHGEHVDKDTKSLVRQWADGYRD